MAVRAADIPHGVKRQMLEEIEKQTGPIQYRQLVDKLGEDGLIDLAFEGMQASASSEPKKSGLWNGIVQVIGCVIWFGALSALGSPKPSDTFWQVIWYIIQVVGWGFVVVWVLALIKSLWEWLFS